MDTNGVSLEPEIQIEESSNLAPQDDDELQIIFEGSNPYKKVKLNMEGGNKKKAPEILEISSDGEDITVGGPSQKKDKASKSSKEEGQEGKKKKKKKSKKKEKDEADDDEEGKAKEKKKEKDEAKKKKKKSKDMVEEEPEGDGEKKKKKKKKDKDKEKEKEKNKEKNGEEKEKEKKKKKKKKEGSKEDDKDKKNKKKQKEKEAKEKKMQEFEKKYPKFISKGKIKFPIDDVLFKLYDIILSEHIPKTKKPAGKSGLIPPVELGDVLQVWNFFSSFPELFSIKNIQQEEIYASLKYDGDEHLYLIDHLHKDILILFVREFIKKNKFETFKDEVEKPFYVLVKYYVGYESPQAAELLLIWTELTKNLFHLSPYGDSLSQTAKRFVDQLAQKTALYYNKLEYKIKIRMLIELINLAYDTELFRDSLQEKMDQVTSLTKEKNELLQEIKQEELEYYDLKAKIEVAEKAQKEEEEKWEQLSRVEVVKRQKETENERKEYQKTLATLNKVETSKEKKIRRVEEIGAILSTSVDTAIRLGIDGNRSEYWIFQGKPDKLYIKLSPIVCTEDTWLYLDEKAELDQLLEALNQKGINEKSLYDKLKEAISHEQLVLRDVKIEEGSTVTGTTGTTTSKAVANGNEQDINYWLAKVQEYQATPEPEEEETEVSKNTRSKVQEQQPEKKIPQVVRPKELKYITVEGIKELLTKTDEKLTQYLDKWHARWGSLKAQEDLRKRIGQAQEAKEFAKILLDLDRNFQSSETPERPKNVEGENEEAENHVDIEEDEDEEEEEEEEEQEEQYDDEEEEEKNDEEENEERYFGGEPDSPKIKKKTRKESGYDDDDEPKIKKKGRKEEKKVIEIEDDEDDLRPKRKTGKNKRKLIEDEEESRRDNESESRLEEEKDEERAPSESQREEKESAMEIEEPEKKEGGMAEEKPAEAENTGEPQEKVKKSALKIWGKHNDRIKRCWLAYTKDVDSIVGVFLSASILCELVELFVEKKNNIYFSRFNSISEYLADKRAKKQAASAVTRTAEKRQGQSQQHLVDKLKQQREYRAESRHKPPPQPAPKYVAQDSFDGYRIKKRGGANRESTEIAEPSSKNGGETKRIRKLNIQESDESESEAASDYNERQRDRGRGTRQSQDKISDAPNVRRSTRSTRLTRRSDMAVESEDEEKECLDCGSTGTKDEIICCMMCDSAYHLSCVGLKGTPDDKWTCINCYQKLASTRQTRSTTRKLH